MTCQTEAKVLCRSYGMDAPPLTTFQLRYPLQIHAELMTHRVFSRNARSSRAVPTARMLEEVRAHPFVPRYWGANQKGMQAGEELNALVELNWLGDPCQMQPYIDAKKKMKPVRIQVSKEEAWMQARDWAIHYAEAFANAGYHKQLANRLLAPFLHIDVVLTTTDLSNWNALRDDAAAEPHIRDLAVAMKQAVEDYGPAQILDPGQWHLPYVTKPGERPTFHGPQHRRVKQSVTRCAQVSYVPFHETKLTPEEEEARHDALVTARPMHASPAEHQATPDRIIGRDADGEPVWEHPKLHGNLTGWIQYRKTLASEKA